MASSNILEIMRLRSTDPATNLKLVKSIKVSILLIVRDLMSWIILFGVPWYDRCRSWCCLGDLIFHVILLCSSSHTFVPPGVSIKQLLVHFSCINICEEKNTVECLRLELFFCGNLDWVTEVMFRSKRFPVKFLYYFRIISNIWFRPLGSLVLFGLDLWDH